MQVNDSFPFARSTFTKDKWWLGEERKAPRHLHRLRRGRRNNTSDSSGYGRNSNGGGGGGGGGEYGGGDCDSTGDATKAIVEPNLILQI